MAGGVLAELDDIGKGVAVFAFEGLENVKAFLELLEASGIDVNTIQITIQSDLQFPELDNRLLVGSHEVFDLRIEAAEFDERATERAHRIQERVVVFVELPQGGLAEFEKAGGVAGPVVIELKFFFFVRVEASGFDFADLMLEQFELSGVGGVIGDQGGFGGGEIPQAADGVGEGAPERFEFAEGVKQRQLLGRMQQGLVVVRSMDIDQPVAERGEGIEGGGRAINELAVGAGDGQGAFEDEESVFAGFEPILTEKCIEGQIKLTEVESGLDCAGFGAETDQGAVGAFSQGEIEGADDDGFPGAGFARNRIVAGLKFESEIGHEREVFDAQAGQHGDILP